MAGVTRLMRMWALVLRGAVGLLLAAGCAAEESPAGTRRVTVWAHHGQARENAAMRAIAAAFNRAHESAKLRVVVEFFPDRQYAEKIAIAAAAGHLPDVLEIDGPLLGPWAAENLLLPLDERVDAGLRADFLPTILAQGTYAGKLYALGAYDSSLVVYYNRRMIERAGLSPPEKVADAWTWGQFVDALERVKPFTKIPLSLHMDEQGDEWFTYAFSPLLWSAGGRLIDTRNNRVRGVLDSPENVGALTLWADLFRRGLAEPTSTNPNPFAAGLAAFDWTGHWMLPGFEATPGLSFGVMPLPRIGPAQVGACGSWCWGMSRDGAHPADAWKVIAWFVDPENGIKPLVTANGAIPSRHSAFRFFPEYKVLPRRLFKAQLEHGARPRPRTRVYMSLTRAFSLALRDIALGAKVDLRLARAADAVQRVLDRRRPAKKRGVQP